jgi:Predicted aminoglycoside phosphotransferase
MNLRREFWYLVHIANAAMNYLQSKMFRPKRHEVESKTKNRKTPQQIARMVERAFPGLTLKDETDALVELKEGWFNAAYNVKLSDDREVILKIAPPKNAEVMTYEKDIMVTEVTSMCMAFQNKAIPVPEIYYFDQACDLCDSAYFFMEKLAGDNLDRVKKELPKAECKSIETQIGKIIKEINQFSGTYFGYDSNPDLRSSTWKEAFIKIVDSVLEDGRRKGAKYGYTIEEIKAVVVHAAHALDEVTTPCLVHWDAWDPNFFVKDGKVTGIIDFERALWADPLMEAQFRALVWGGVSESMKGYGKTTFTHQEDVRNHLYTLHLALVMKTEHYYRNYDTQEISNTAMMMILPTMKWLQEH